MKSKILHWFAIVLILQTGLVHFMAAQGEFEEAAYMGFLFIGNFLAALLAAYGIYQKRMWGWVLGLFIAVTSIAAYAWSRTQGMPGMEVEEWITPYGVFALSVEGVYILVCLFRPWKNSAEQQAPAAVQPYLRFSLPLAIFVLLLISVSAYRWDNGITQSFGMHVVSVQQVLRNPELSQSELEAQYGVQVSLVAVSLMDSIVDVRIKVIDPDKAQALLKNQAALLVDQQNLVLAPHMHSHIGPRLKTNKMFIVFFPTQHDIQRGSLVSLVFGSNRVEPIVVR
jgi:hypothetical protein